MWVKMRRLSWTLLLCSVGVLAEQHSEHGVASYYAKRSHKILLADGKRYSSHELFAAHRSLPFGTEVKVVNLKNGKEVTVFIADRGPFVRGRVIDLSWEAARRLGMLRSGLAPVRTEVLK